MEKKYIIFFRNVVVKVGKNINCKVHIYVNKNYLSSTLKYFYLGTLHHCQYGISVSYFKYICKYF